MAPTTLAIANDVSQGIAFRSVMAFCYEMCIVAFVSQVTQQCAITPGGAHVNMAVNFLFLLLAQFYLLSDFIAKLSVNSFALRSASGSFRFQSSATLLSSGSSGLGAESSA